MSDVDTAAALVGAARRLVVFTGAGVSAESGIDTFRGSTDAESSAGDALWKRYPPEKFATPAGLVNLLVTEPLLVARFFRELLAPVARAVPNAGHRAIASLEERARAAGGDAVVITQNVDRLHHDAGSQRVLEVHGSLFDIVDGAGDTRRTLSRDDLKRVVDDLSRAERGYFKRAAIVRALSPLLHVLDLSSRSLVHRPSVVLFGEALPEPAWSDALAAAGAADVFLVVGTSGSVYPAASLPEIAADAGATVVGVGPARGDADVWLDGTAGAVLPGLLQRLR